MPGTKAATTLRSIAIRLSLSLLLAFLLTACQPDQLAKQQFLQFGTLIEVTLVTSGDDAARLFGDIERLLQIRHRQWHGWLDGDLKQFNEALTEKPGREVAVPASLRELIQDSHYYPRLSDGLFNPAIGRLVAAWGFHRQHPPDHEMIALISQDIPGMDDLILRGQHASTRHAQLQLDFGGIAKGLAVRQIAELLQRNHIRDFIINAGGDVFAAGRKGSRAWRVAIDNPFADGIAAGLELRAGESIFTSGNYRRFQTDDQQRRRHHIIDPRTGEPSTIISAATVIHPDPVRADVAATTLMITTPAGLRDMARALDIDQFLVITNDRQVFVSDTLQRRLSWRQPEDFSFQQL